MKPETLTIERLKQIQPGEIISQGTTANSPEGILMTDYDIGKELLWIAKKGHGYDDWCIYAHWAENGLDFVITNGDKVTSERNIKKLVPCTEEVYSLYRF